MGRGRSSSRSTATVVPWRPWSILRAVPAPPGARPATHWSKSRKSGTTAPAAAATTVRATPSRRPTTAGPPCGRHDPWKAHRKGRARCARPFCVLGSACSGFRVLRPPLGSPSGYPAGRGPLCSRAAPRTPRRGDRAPRCRNRRRSSTGHTPIRTLCTGRTSP